MPRMRSRRAVLALLAALAAVAAPSVAASPQPASAASPTLHRTVSGWIPYWSAGTSYAVTLRNAAMFGTASPFWYAAAAGSVRSETGAGNRTMIDGLHRAGVAVVPTVTSPLSASQVAGLGADPVRRRAHVDALMRVVASRAYDGLDMNYEQMMFTTSRAQAARTRAGYTAIATDLCRRLHAARKQCVITVLGRTSDAFSVWHAKLIPAVYDYAALGAIADRVRVMAYDEHTGSTGPGPIASIGWVEDIARYTASRVAPAKVELGVPLYGRHWSGSSLVGSVTAPQAVALARSAGARVRWSATTASPRAAWTAGGQRHVVHFSDARSVAVRQALAKRYGFAGTALWAPGQEDPATWAQLRAGATW